MFIKDGKSVISNSILILAIVILFIIMLMSYNKCMKPETFINTTGNTTIKNSTNNMNSMNNMNIRNNMNAENNYQMPINVRINIMDRSLTVNFSLDIMNGKKLPKNFLIVLIQYDNNMVNTGNNKFYMSNEYEINSSVSSDSKTSNNVCILSNGIPSCQYIFDNLDIIDTNGNIFYYKIGVSAIYEDGNSGFATPLNVNSINKVFTLNESIDYQNSIYDEFLEFKKQKEMLNSASNPIYKNNDLLSSADGQYEFIKAQLGGYPDNLILNDRSNVQNSLNDLVDKSMAQGSININVSAFEKLKEENNIP